MKVEIGAFTLFDHAANDGAALFGQSGAIRRLVDESSPIGAAQIVTFFRTTRSTDFRFSVSRPAVASGESALAEWFTHEAAIPGDSPLVITTENYVVTIPGNLTEVGLPRIVGSRLWHDYTFRGGVPVVTDAEGGDDVSQLDRTYETLSVSSVGNSTLTLTAVHRETAAEVTVGAGSGAYTRKLILPTASRRKGDRALLRIAMPASANPTLELRNASASGTTLETYSGFAGDAETYVAELVYSGTAWRLISSRNEPS